MLVDAQVAHISFDHPGHSRRHVGVLTANPVQVKQETYHKISFQHHAVYILDVIVTGVAGDTLILIEDVINRQFDLPIFSF